MPATLTRPTVTRLLERVSATSGRVDREAGVIYGVRILGQHSSNKRKYTDEAMRSAVSLYEGAQVNIDHPEPNAINRERRSRDRFGELRNVRFEQSALWGDLYFLRTHPMAATICESAERRLGGFGLSHNVDGRGRPSGGVYIVESILQVFSVDVVSSPGTNKTLFESAGAGDGFPRGEDFLRSIDAGGRHPARRLREAEGDTAIDTPEEDARGPAAAKRAIRRLLGRLDSIPGGQIVSTLEDLTAEVKRLMEEPAPEPMESARMPQGKAFLEAIGVRPKPSRSRSAGADSEPFPRGDDFLRRIGAK